MTQIIIRPMVPDDRRAFCELTASRPGYDARKADERTSVIWHIAFQNPTSDGQPTYFVASRGQRILCHMGRMPTWFWVGGKRHLASFAHDLFGHPELQATGRGFFVTMKLYKSVEDACASFCGLVWTNEINVKLQQSRKYDQLWTTPWIRPLDATRALSRLKLPGPLSKVASSLATLGLRSFDAAAALALRSKMEVVKDFDGRFDRLTERVGPLLGIAPIKTSAYLNWRYRDWPYLRTTTLALTGDLGELRGYVVLREPSAGEDTGRILDIVADPTDDRALMALAAAALRHYRRRDLARVECVSTAPSVQRALKRLLFVERGEPLPLFFLNANKFDDPGFLKKAEHWHHVFGDSEGGEVP